MHLGVPLREFEKAIIDAEGPCKRSMILAMRQLLFCLRRLQSVPCDAFQNVVY